MNNTKTVIDIRVYGIPKKLHDDLKNIADYYGLDLSALVRSELRKIADSYPEHIKQFQSLPHS